MVLGERLAKVRKRLGWSQMDLAVEARTLVGLSCSIVRMNKN